MQILCGIVFRSIYLHVFIEIRIGNVVVWGVELVEILADRLLLQGDSLFARPGNSVENLAHLLLCLNILSVFYNILNMNIFIIKIQNLIF